MYSYRNATRADYSTICGFPKDSSEVFFMSPKLKYPLTSEQLELVTIDRMNQTVILDEHQQVVGYANFYQLQDHDLFWLGNVIVSPNFRGNGAAEYLIRTMMTTAKDELKLRELHLVCHNVNTRGILFYSRLGFKLLKEQIHKVQPSQGYL